MELPKTAFITNFTLWVSPQLLALGGEGNLLSLSPSFSNSLSLQDHRWCYLPWERLREKEVAKKQYEKAAVPGQKTAGLVKLVWTPRPWGECQGCEGPQRLLNKRTAAIIITWQNVL